MEDNSSKQLEQIGTNPEYDYLIKFLSLGIYNLIKVYR